jgi:multiple sugar transport system permease protein
MYRQGFRWWSLGSATAIAFVLFAIMLAVSALALRPGGRVEAVAPFRSSTPEKEMR